MKLSERDLTGRYIFTSTKNAVGFVGKNMAEVLKTALGFIPDCYAIKCKDKTLQGHKLDGLDVVMIYPKGGK